MMTLRHIFAADELPRDAQELRRMRAAQQHRRCSALRVDRRHDRRLDVPTARGLDDLTHFDLHTRRHGIHVEEVGIALEVRHDGASRCDVLSRGHRADHQIRVRNCIFDIRRHAHGLAHRCATWRAVGDREKDVPHREIRQTAGAKIADERLPDFAESQQTNLQTHPRLHT
jgi:hypothetical protein